MPIKLTPDSFLNGVRQSHLIKPERLDKVLAEMRAADVSLDDTDRIAEGLVERDIITRWQADKLLQGKFKGFLLGNYRLKMLLGKGEMSSVYLAEHAMMKRRCAIKVLPAIKVKDTSYLGRFHREAEAVAALDHPNIVRAYDVGMEVEAGTDIHYLVMEFVDGQSLEAKYRNQDGFSVVEAAEYMRQAALGLAHAHENGLVHRDVKPSNLLVDKKGVVRLLDLGLARFFKSTDEESLTIKHDEKVLGTADFLAPEQAVDSHNVDERADIYSLGCTFYFALTGQPPFTDGTLVQRLLAHQTKAPPPLKKFRQDVPESLNGILDRMLKKHKDDRFQSMTEVAEALGRWLIANGPREWKVAHPEVVASLTGIDALLPSRDRIAIARRGTATTGTPREVAARREKSLKGRPRRPESLRKVAAESTQAKPREDSNAVESVNKAPEHKYTLPPPALSSKRAKSTGFEPRSSLSLPIDRKVVLAGVMIVAGLFGIAGIAMKLTANVDGTGTVDVETPDDIEIGDTGN